MDIKIYKDSNAVKVLAAQARGESQDTALVEETNELIKEQAQDLSPENKYRIAQLVGFTVDELARPASNWLDNIADVKRIGFGDKAQFKVKQEGIRAYIQAKGATTARSKVADRTFSLDTVAVSARPVINIVELKTGRVQMSDLIVDAAYQMELAKYGLLQRVLNDAAKTWQEPYYGTGNGIVKATFDPMVRHWTRLSAGAAPVILGDIEMTSKLADLTGFAAANNTQFSNDIINEQNNAGFIGRYIGANVVNLVNPLVAGTDDPLFNTNKLFILPSGADASMRPLKYVEEGDVITMEQTNIDDQSYEVRLDQYIGAGIAYGDRPYISMYEDSAV